MNKNISIFSDKAFYKKLIRLTLPIALQSLMLAAVAAADAIMLGRIEQNSMAAVSLATQIQFVQNMIISSIVSAASILGAQYWGKGDKKTMQDIFNMILRLAGLVSIIFFAICRFIPVYLMKIFSNDQNLIEIGAEYLRIASWSYLLTGISECFLTMMKVSEHAKTCAFISSSAVILNILLNAVFIFGLFSVPAFGAKGAAISTLIARIVEICLAIGFSFKKSFLHPSFTGLFKRNKLLSKDFAKCALPLLGGCLFWGVGFTSYTAIIGHLGADAAAANSVAAVIRDLMCCLCTGLGAAGGIVVGNELGSGNLEKGKIYGDRLTVISILLGVFCAVVIVAISPLAVNYIKLNSVSKNYLYGMLFIVAVYMIARCITSVVINGIFGAGGDTLFDMYSLAACMWGIAIPLSILGAFVFHWPVLVVYGCTCLDEIGKIPWVLAHYKKYKWVKDLTR